MLDAAGEQPPRTLTRPDQHYGRDGRLESQETLSLATLATATAAPTDGGAAATTGSFGSFTEAAVATRLKSPSTAPRSSSGTPRGVDCMPNKHVEVH